MWGHQEARWVRTLLALIVAMAALVVGTAQPTLAGHDRNPYAIDPDQKYFGKSYGEWGAAWWRWAGAFPLDAGPITEGSGPVEFGDADDQPGGPVWFLAGNFGGAVDRKLTVPRGKSLFMPLVNFVFWNPEDCRPLELPANCSATQLRQAMRSIQLQTVELKMSIDLRPKFGRERHVEFKNLGEYTGLSGPFKCRLPRVICSTIPATYLASGTRPFRVDTG